MISKQHLWRQWVGMGSLCWLLTQPIVAQVVINEFSAANKSNYLDNYGEYEDWVELYNMGATSVNLQGYYLSDDPTNLTQWTIPNVSIPANGRKIIFLSNRDVVVGASVHANFKLTQMRQESVILSNPGGTILDSYTITTPMQRNHSIGRATDGTGAWKVFPFPTPNATNNSAVDYDRYADKPVFSIQAGFYPGAITVSLSAEANSTIRYTTDGTPPSQTSTLYTGPINVPSTRIIRAKVYSNNGNVHPSFTESNSYFINETFSFPVISIASDEFTDLFNSFTDEIVSTFEYFENQQFVLETEGDVRGHGNDSWAFPQKGMRFYVRDQYGYSNKIDHPLFPTSPRSDYDVVILKAAGSDNYPNADLQWGAQSCHLRDAYSQTIAEKYNLNVDVRRFQSIIIFINGQYWGLYELRERIDSDFTDYYYDQPEAYVDMLKFWGWLNVEYGSPADWDALDAYMDANSMSVQANYDYVKTQLDPMSFIDYFVLNTYTANSDWLNWNTAWWRGRKAPGVRWRYQLWDMDNTFDLGQNYTGLGTTTFNNSPCDVQNLFPNDPDIEHTDMFANLLTNDEFFDLYINRYADLLNTAFNCDTMLAHFDALVASIAPEMPRQIARWGGSMAQWQANVAYMRGQISGRCAVIDQSFVNCYTPQISTPKDIRVDVSPAGAGNARINTITPNSYPWTGSYFGGVNISCKATPNTGYIFDHWVVNHSTILPNANADSIYFQFNSADTVVAVFIPNISVSGTAVNDNCNSSGTGSISLVPSGGTAPFSFVWSNGATTQDLAGITAGTYSVTMTDINGTTTTQTFTVANNAAPTVNNVANAPLCLSGSNGNIDLTLTGGTAPYTYLWNNGLGTNEDINNLSVGNYTVTITDAANCTLTQSFTLADGNSPSLIQTVQPTACAGSATGGIDAAASGGLAPYTFVWNTGATTEDLSGVLSGTYTLTATDVNGCTTAVSATINDGVSTVAIAQTAQPTACSGSATGSIDASPSSGLAPYTFLWNNGATTEDLNGVLSGTYTLTATDANGCTATASATINDGASTVAIVQTAQPTACSGSATGSIDASASGGLAPYTFVWNTGATTEDLNGIAAGNYLVTATDANGCTAVSSVSVTNGISTLALSQTNQPTACNGSATGSINASASGGLAPYTFLWNTGATTADISGLVAGNYTLVSTDANGCTAAINVAITNGANPLSLGQSTTDAACASAATGSIDVTVVGGLSPYIFAWSNGATTEDISGLPVGAYSLLTTDANGCTAMINSTVALSFNPVTVTQTNKTDISCKGANDGRMDIAVTGGLTPYTFAWNTGATTEDLAGLGQGTYTLVVTDGHGCTASANALLTEPVALSLALDVTDATSGDNGTITATVSGGTSPYGYLWDDAQQQTTATAIELPGGTYQLVVTDANNCTITASAEVLSGSIDCVKPTMTITPNGDGINDLWVMDCIFTWNNEVTVYNRWGQVVFAATNYDNTWDGSHNGTALPDGGYFYLITVTTPQDGDKVLKGALNIVR